MSTRFWQSLAFQTGCSIALGSILLTLVLSITIYDSTVETVVDDSNHRISQLVSTVEISAAIAAYLENNELGLDITRGLIRNDIVTGVILHSESGMRIISGPPFHFSDENVLQFPLISPFMPDEKIGKLFVKPNQHNIDAQAKKTAELHVITLAVHSLMITLFVIFLVNNRLTQPLMKLAGALHKIEPGSEERLQYPKQHLNDEIGFLTRDVNQLLGAAQNTLEGERRLREYVESLEKQTRKEADRDPLTNLLNRRAGERAIAKALKKAEADNTRCAILLIDLDSFKPINDTYGHEAGDQTLIKVSDRLTSTLRKSDIVIRWGGDEFLIMVRQGHSDLKIDVVSEKILKALAADIAINETTRESIGASIGISLYPEHATDSALLFDLADKAMYHIKRSGRNGYFIHGSVDMADQA